MIVFRDYPYWKAETLDDIKRQMAQICHTRKDDITQINNVQSTFVAGRKVGKIPVSSMDVSASDKLGDINYDASFLYILIDNSGTAEWRRASLGSW